MSTPTDPRAIQLAEARYRNGYGATSETAWDTLDSSLREFLTAEADAWLRAAVEAGIAPLAERPTGKHMAVYVDDEGFLYGEYPTIPESDSILRLVWASEACDSKGEMEGQGVGFRFLGWST